MNQYYLIRRNLLDKVVRILDLRDVLKITLSNNKKIRRLITREKINIRENDKDLPDRIVREMMGL